MPTLELVKLTMMPATAYVKLRQRHKQGELLTDLDPADIARLREDGTIGGGMIPKLETCVHAVEGGCDAAVVLDGRVAHAMLLEFFTEQGAGTLIRTGVRADRTTAPEAAR